MIPMVLKPDRLVTVEQLFEFKKGAEAGMMGRAAEGPINGIKEAGGKLELLVMGESKAAVSEKDT
jgi:hypothetical protein